MPTIGNPATGFPDGSSNPTAFPAISGSEILSAVTGASDVSDLEFFLEVIRYSPPCF
jgi:hypothetical protein